MHFTPVLNYTQCCYYNTFGCYSNTFGCYFNSLWGSVQTLYRVSHKKRNGGFSVQCELEVLNILTSLDKASSAEENDT